MANEQRVLFCVGCDAYDNVQPLKGAEKDARRMFEALTDTDKGAYARERSRLVLSPTLEELRSELLEALFAGGPLDTFTFFFAGHGSVSGGTFYMAVKNSRVEALSMSAFSLSELFRSLNEAQPPQSNIIMDACESGGLIKDLRTILNSGSLGEGGSPAISLLATSAMDQTSKESAEGGLGTLAILDCVEGRDFVQDRTSTLDLLDIGRRLTERFRDTGQSPVVWALNLLESPRFCRNPKYGIDPAAPLKEVLTNLPATRISGQDGDELLWSVFSSLRSEKWNPRGFQAEVTRLLAHQSTLAEVYSDIVVRLSVVMSERARAANDVFRPALVLACLATTLLPFVENDTARNAAGRLLMDTAHATRSALTMLVEDLEREKYALLSSHGGLSELYYLPLRVADLLGWSAACCRISSALGLDFSEHAVQEFKNLYATVLDHYGNSMVAMSDQQASSIALALSTAIRFSMVDEAEETVGRLLNSLVDCRGNLARGDIRPEDVIGYLLARSTGEWAHSHELVERPTELLTVVFKAAARLDLFEVVDPLLWRLDGLPFQAFLCNDYKKFSSPLIRDGSNLVWGIGHDFFRLSDLMKSWPTNEALPSSSIEAELAVLCSLLFPDRVPWFCFEATNSASGASKS
jgi:hypothetical protein